MITKVIAKSGRRWKETRGGIDDLTQVYQLVLDAPLTVRDESALVALGLPPIGSAHPKDAGLIVASYEVEEGVDSAKATLNVTVHYTRDAISIERKEREEGSEEPGEEYACEEWGWESGEDSRELTVDATGKPVLNSAGDPFESVPSVTVPAPTFRKVMKFAERQTGYSEYDGKVNHGEMTIGDIVCPARTLLCSIQEKRIFDSDKYHYQYTVALRKRSNVYHTRGVDGEQSGAIEAGWDVAIVDTGMRVREGELQNYRKHVPEVVDKETGKLMKIASPVLLDGKGQMLEAEDDKAPVPVVLQFFAYDEANFPKWFYSEPEIKKDPEPEEPPQS